MLRVCFDSELDSARHDSGRHDISFKHLWLPVICKSMAESETAITETT